MSRDENILEGLRAVKFMPRNLSEIVRSLIFLHLGRGSDCRNLIADFLGKIYSDSHKKADSLW